MLRELLIRNFAIIDQLDLTFAPGFNVFTGETGAGKSIILDAVSAVVGGKTDATFVREGTERASVEAIFDFSENREAVSAILAREDLLDDLFAAEVTLTREIRAEGRSTARINGHSVNAGLLREVGQYLIDIHGQSDHLSLLNPASHIALVDRFAGNQALLQQYQQTLRKYQKVRAQLNSIRLNEDEILRQKDMLAFQINEIQSAKLNENEEETLKQDRDRLANAENLSQWALKGIENLEGKAGEFPGILDLLGYLTRSMDNLTKTDASLQPLAEELTGAREQLNEISTELQSYQESLEFNPRRLEILEDRLQLLQTLKRKYGGTIAAVIAFERNASEKLNVMDHTAEQTDALQHEAEVLLDQLSEQAQALSQRRHQTAKRISQRVETELDDLKMSAARFEVQFSERTDENGLKDGSGAADRRLAYTETGFDTVEFLIAPNPGEGLKPLAKIASGGETSRLMLALKNTLAAADAIPVMIFDEIDQGIGGRVGAIVGEKLWKLSQTHQVLCITHLPQLAAYYDAHYHVFKQIRDGRTFTTVKKLTAADSTHELALLLGADSRENALAADAMIQSAQSHKTH